MSAKWTEAELKILDELKDSHGPVEIAKIITTKSSSAISSRLSRDRKKPKDLDPFAKKEPEKLDVKKSNKTKVGNDNDDVKEKPVALFKKPKYQSPIRLHPLDAVGANDCRWPLGTPGHLDFSFCREKTVGNGPYCAEHTRRAFTNHAQARSQEEALTK